jgi:uncharacterized protein
MTEEEGTKSSILGTGWAFPPRFSKPARSALMVSDREDIEQSLAILFSTGIGERFLQPKYGCNLDDYVFETFNATVLTSMRLNIKKAIQIYEPRIRVAEVVLNTDLLHEGRIDIILEYTIIATNSRFNLVYPFYLNEANRSI